MYVVRDMLATTLWHLPGEKMFAIRDKYNDKINTVILSQPDRKK